MKIAVSKVLNITLMLLLLIVLFTNATASTSEDGYDSWVDYDESGTVDYMDLYHFARAYEEIGDPTKSVNVTNWPTQQLEPSYKVITVWNKKGVLWSVYGGVHAIATERIYVGGYSTMFVYLQVTNISSMQLATTDVYVVSLAWYPYVTTEHTPDEPFWETAGNPIHKLSLADTDWDCAKYEVKGPTLYFEVNIYPRIYSGNALISLYVYLRNE